MKIEEYKDGLAFVTDDGRYEIAFYSNIMDWISYNQYNGYKKLKSIGCIELPYEDNLKIIEEVRRYKKSLEV